jgi:poly-gamma-glutamate synthesis protein (capsule biosynthesis protein)
MNRLRVAVVAAADHPVEWAAASSRPGLFYVGISPAEDFTPVAKALAEARRRAEFVIFTIHWGPNMCERPSAEFRDFAHRVIGSGADVFWGHSAHVVQGVEVVGGRPILYDTGDLVDDYMVDETLRNDLSAVFFLRVDEGRVRSIDLLPVKIAMEQVRRATGADREWFADRMRARCAEMDTPVLPGPDRGFLAIPVAREARVSPSKP